MLRVKTTQSNCYRNISHLFTCVGLQPFVVGDHISAVKDVGDEVVTARVCVQVVRRAAVHVHVHHLDSVGQEIQSGVDVKLDIPNAAPKCCKQKYLDWCRCQT